MSKVDRARYLQQIVDKNFTTHDYCKALIIQACATYMRENGILDNKTEIKSSFAHMYGIVQSSVVGALFMSNFSIEEIEDELSKVLLEPEETVEYNGFSN